MTSCTSLLGHGKVLQVKDLFNWGQPLKGHRASILETRSTGKRLPQGLREPTKESWRILLCFGVGESVALPLAHRTHRRSSELALATHSDARETESSSAILATIRRPFRRVINAVGSQFDLRRTRRW